MTTAPEQERPQPAPGEEPDDDRGLEFSGRAVLTLCGFLAAMILGLYLLLPQLAGLEDTWSRIEDGSPAWIGLAFVLTIGMFWGYVEMFRGVFSKVGEGLIGRTESLPDHDGRPGRLTDLRRGRRRRPRPAGVGAAPGGPAPSASSPTRRSASCS